ncbi:hypothetical protein [Chelativorans sp. YIM 93263]|uniref:hypothetical protein n=1 Tax=Chelativorans sp. YIM 93263 TaxID=2906648 RepID=UPI0023785903|nr:hypothetical protein [Chelativorans sp. YIM 93263]
MMEHSKSTGGTGISSIIYLMRSICVSVALALFHLAIGPTAAGAQTTPFANGDQMPDMTATCEDLGYWIEQLPNSDHRIDMAVAGPLAAVEFDGALAYLVVCPADGPQALCITYSTNGMEPGEHIKMSGGTQRIASNKIILDPCLAVRD